MHKHTQSRLFLESVPDEKSVLVGNYAQDEDVAVDAGIPYESNVSEKDAKGAIMDLDKKRINEIIKKLSAGLYEKEEVIALTLLCALAGKSIFLFGLPGTAKSLIVRRIASAFEDSKYFGQLMNRFSTPEDVFGPVSLAKLKEDKFERQMEGYLPTADFVFLDEIWKSSPAILNTLLTIINEKIYRNGSQEVKVPLKALVAASNETPPKGQGLEAMYDRFIMRLLVEPAKGVDNFKSLIVDKDISFDVGFSKEEKISTKDWEELKNKIESIKVPENVLNIIIAIKSEIEEYNKNNEPIYISDRRWKNIVSLLKAAAHFCDRKEIQPVDCFLISHCVWTLEENIEDVKKIVEKSIRIFSQINKKGSEALFNEIKELKRDIANECIHDKDIYEIEMIGGKECCKIQTEYRRDNYSNISNIDLYVPIENRNTTDRFYALKSNGEACNYFQCFFQGENLVIEKYYCYPLNDKKQALQQITKQLPIKTKKGTFKTLTPRTRQNYIKGCDDLMAKIESVVKEAEKDLNRQKEKIDSAFVCEGDRNIILGSYEDYIADLKSKRHEVEQERKKVEKCQTTK